MAPTKSPPTTPALPTADDSLTLQLYSGNMASGEPTSRPWRHGIPALNEGDMTSWVGKGEQ